MRVVKPEDIIAWLEVQIGDQQTRSDFAREIGVHVQTIYDVLEGKNLPSKSMLEKLGLRVVYQIFRPLKRPRRKPTTPAKRKRKKGE